MIEHGSFYETAVRLQSEAGLCEKLTGATSKRREMIGILSIVCTHQSAITKTSSSLQDCPEPHGPLIQILIRDSGIRDQAISGRGALGYSTNRFDHQWRRAIRGNKLQDTTVHPRCDRRAESCLGIQVLLPGRVIALE